MEYIDFTKKKIELHKEVENAIKNIMTEKGVRKLTSPWMRSTMMRDG